MAGAVKDDSRPDCDSVTWHKDQRRDTEEELFMHGRTAKFERKLCLHYIKLPFTL